MNITLVQVYAPTTDDAPDKVIEEFYEVVQEGMDNIPKKADANHSHG